MRYFRAGLALAGLLSSLLTAMPLVAQQCEDGGISPALPPRHPALSELAIAGDLGLVGEFHAAQDLVPAGVTLELLRCAAVEAEARGVTVAPLVHAWSRSAGAEVPDLSRGGIHVWGRAAVGFQAITGALSPGSGTVDPDIPPARQSDEGYAVGELVMATAWRDRAAVTGQILVGVDGAEFPFWEARTRLGRTALSLGRFPVGYASGIVFSGAELVRLQLETEQPVRFPGYAKWLGPATLHTSIARLSGERYPGRPYLWTMRAAIRPHPRLLLGVQRGSMFGGDSTEVPVSPSSVLRMLIGRHSGDFENQIFSVQARWRLPTDAVVPIVLFGEWGAEDSAGALEEAPGVVVGATVPAVPGLPWISTGVEYAYFGVRCCRVQNWYVHHQFRGGWANDDQLLGHPLGGDGSEWRAHSVAYLWDARLRFAAAFFLRNRAEGNLWAPDREGQSRGISIDMRARTPLADVRIEGRRELGVSWEEAMFKVGLMRYF